MFNLNKVDHLLLDCDSINVFLVSVTVRVLGILWTTARRLERTAEFPRPQSPRVSTGILKDSKVYLLNLEGELELLAIYIFTSARGLAGLVFRPAIYSKSWV